MRNLLILLLLAVATTFSHAITVASFSAEMTTGQIETNLSQLQSELRKTQQGYDEGLQRVREIEASITREKQERGGRPSRKLSKMLRKAQEYAINAETLQQTLDTLRGEVANYREQLRQRYSTRLRDILEKLEGGQPDKQRKELLEQLARTLDTWDRLQEVQSPVFAGTGILSEKPDLRVTETDSPEQILAKSDLARDNADWLRARAYQVEVRLAQIEAEQKLRSRLGAFVDEIALFDDVPTVQVAPKPTEEAILSGDRKLLDTPEPPTETQQAPLDTEITWLLPPELDGMDLASQIENLQQYKARLSAKAKEYDKLAQELQRNAERILDIESQKQ